MLVAAAVMSLEPALCQAQQQVPETNVVRLDGLDIEFDKQGNWSKIYSTYTQPVDVPDRRGIKKAQVIAEEKGKAQIVRFLQQNVSSERLVTWVMHRIRAALRA